MNKVLGDMDDPPHHCFVSARWLNNSRVLLELDSKEAAIWQGDLLKWASFLGHFAPEATVKMRSYLLIIQFVPLYFKPEGEADLKTVEADNKLPAGVIWWAHWIKPAYRWALEQTCSHVMLTLSMPEVVNIMLTNGLVIFQKRVYIEKCWKEPTYCLKCHSWGHLSYDCLQAFDTCGTCAGCHQTTDCTQRNRLCCTHVRSTVMPTGTASAPPSYINVKS